MQREDYIGAKTTHYKELDQGEITPNVNQVNTACN